MALNAIRSDKLSAPVGPFSQAVQSGEFIFLSGQVGQDAATGKLAPGGVEGQAKQLFRNLAASLEAAGKTFRDVVRVGVYLTDIQDFAAVNALYAEQFKPPFPARTTIAVAALPLGAAIEIDLVAQA